MRTRLKPGTIERARFQRKNPTEGERKLWYKLREFNARGFHFRRQAPFCGYIVDFLEHSSRIVIELDESEHGEALYRPEDEIEDRVIEQEGYRVLRFSNVGAGANLYRALDRIRAELGSRRAA